MDIKNNRNIINFGRAELNSTKKLYCGNMIVPKIYLKGTANCSPFSLSLKYFIPILFLPSSLPFPLPSSLPLFLSLPAPLLLSFFAGKHWPPYHLN